MLDTFHTLILNSYLAAMVDGFHTDFIQPYALRTPEVILGKGWDTSADIWSLGCDGEQILFSQFDIVLQYI